MIIADKPQKLALLWFTIKVFTEFSNLSLLMFAACYCFTFEFESQAIGLSHTKFSLFEQFRECNDFISLLFDARGLQFKLLTVLKCS